LAEESEGASRSLTRYRPNTRWCAVHAEPPTITVGLYRRRAYTLRGVKRRMVNKISMEKVLFVIGTRQFGGLETVLLDWLAQIDYSKSSVVLASLQPEMYSRKLAEKGLPVKMHPLPSPAEGPFWRVFPKWISFFASIRPQKVILLEGEVPDLAFAAFVAAYLFNRQNLIVFESLAPEPLPHLKPKLHFGFLPGLGLWRYRDLWNVRIRGYLARKTLTMSHGIRDKLIAYYGYPSKNTSVLYHGIDTRRYCPSRAARTEFRRAHGIPEDAIVIVSHGRLSPIKRVDRILQAFQTLSADHENLWLLLTKYDFGPTIKEVEQAVARMEQRHRVKLLSFQDEVSRMIQASDIYVLASDNEGFGIALVEAMSVGLVCVATNVTGPSEIIVDGQNGFLVEKSEQGVLNGLKGALALENSEKESMQNQARVTAEEKWDLRDAVGRALEAIGVDSRSEIATS